MSLTLRLVLIVVSIGFLVFALRQTAHARQALRYLLVWIFLGILGILAALFPGWVFSLSSLLGFEKPVNFLLFACVAFLMIVTLLSGVSAAREANKRKILAQKLALLDARVRELEQQNISALEQQDTHKPEQ